MNIVLVHTSDDGGGAEKCVFGLHQAFKELGHQSRLFVKTKKTNDPDVIEIPRFRCFPGLLRTVKWLEDRNGWQYLYQPWFRQLDRLIGKADVVNFHSLWSANEGYADVGGLPYLTKKYPSVITLHDWWMFTGHCAAPPRKCEKWKIGCGTCPDLRIPPAIQVDGTKSNWIRKQRNYKKSKFHIVTVSNALGKMVSESPLLRDKPCTTIYNNFDTSTFYPRDKQLIRKELGIPEDKFVVLVAGQSAGTNYVFNRGYPVDYAGEILEYLGHEIFIIAVGKYSSDFMQSIKTPGIAVPHVNMETLSKYYSSANITLTTSLRESFGRIPAESQLCGTPVVGFASDGVAENVIDGQTGWLAPVYDVKKIIKIIKEVIFNKEELERRSNNASLHTRRNFSNAVIANKYIDLFKNIMQNNLNTK